MRREEDEENGGVPVLPTSSSSTRRVERRADPFLIVCRCFSLITSLAAILCIAVNVLSAVRSFKNPNTVSIFLLLSAIYSFIGIIALIYNNSIFFFFFIDFRWHISLLRSSHCDFCGSR